MTTIDIHFEEGGGATLVVDGVDITDSLVGISLKYRWGEDVTTLVIETAGDPDEVSG